MPKFYQIAAILVTIGLFGLMWIYVQEFPFFSNTIQVGRLILMSELASSLALGAFLYWKRERFFPWHKHYPEILALTACLLFFAPLAGSRLNRMFYNTEDLPFQFVSETPFVASAFGLLKDDKRTPTGYHLKVTRHGKLYRFRTRQRAYFPLSQAGDSILLPVKKGWIGFRILNLE